MSVKLPYSKRKRDETYIVVEAHWGIHHPFIKVRYETILCMLGPKHNGYGVLLRGLGRTMDLHAC